MKISGLVRGSDEDFRNIFSANSPDEAWEEVRNYVTVSYILPMKRAFLSDPRFSEYSQSGEYPVSTIGAGDNFNAGILTSIHQMNISRAQLERLTGAEWSVVIETAVAFATHVA